MNKGDICYADFPFEENAALAKRRTVLVWKISEDGMFILASKITGTIRGLRWEVPVPPNIYNGLTKQSVIRIDQTRALSILSFSPPIGALNQIGLEIAENRLKEFLSVRGKE